MKKYTRRSQWQENEAEERISELEDRLMEIIHSEQWKEKQFLKNGNHLRAFWDNIKHTNIHIIGVPGGGEREKWRRLERRQVKWQETREGKNERGREKIGENDK